MSLNTDRVYSSYYEAMEEKVKTRYLEKLDILGEGVSDPYTFVVVESRSLSNMPSIEYPDIYNYLINTPSPYTKEELKSYKSLMVNGI